jgi:hypothetical protein
MKSLLMALGAFFLARPMISILLVLMAIALGTVAFVMPAMKEKEEKKKGDRWEEKRMALERKRLERKNDLVNLLYEKGFLTDDEHCCLLHSNIYSGNRYIIADPYRVCFQDSALSAPFLDVYTDDDNKLVIRTVEEGDVVDSSVEYYK